MPERDYSHRNIVDKLGVKEGHAVAFAENAFRLESELRTIILARTGRAAAGLDETCDIVLAPVDASTDVVSILREWRARIQQNGGIWLLTPKRGLPGYINQTELIPAGAEAGLVDNKTCSVSDIISGMRFVIRRADRSG